jgi:hypothetical protein
MSIVNLKKHKLYTVFFEDSNKWHIFAKFIQFCQKYSTTGVDGYNPNHIGSAFLDFRKTNKLLEAVVATGNTLTSLDKKIKEYKGTIRIYDTSINFSEVVLNSIINENANKKYGILSPFSALEFAYKKKTKGIIPNILFLVLNSFLDILKIFIPFGKGSFCVKLWLQVIMECDVHKKSLLVQKLQARYENAKGEIDFDELTPADALLSTHQAKNKLIYTIKNGEIIFDANVHI